VTSLSSRSIRGVAVCAAILANLALGPVLFAAEYHVDPDVGSDSNPGTAGSPWWSLRYALGQLSPGDTLYVHEATYPVSGTGTLYLESSGAPGAWITMQAYPGDNPVITVPTSGGLVTDEEEYFILDAIDFEGCSTSLVARSSYFIVRNCTFSDSTYGPHIKTNSGTRQRHILIENNAFSGCSDIALFPDNVDEYVVRGNTLCDGDSVLMDPGGVSNLVIENNFAYNTAHWLGELKIRWGNYESWSGENCRGGIVRRNVFVNGGRYLVLLASPNGCAVYNNTLVTDSGCADGLIFMQRDGTDAPEGGNKHNLIKNNIIHHAGTASGLCLKMDGNMSEDFGDQQIDYNLYYRPNEGNHIVYGGTYVTGDALNGWYGGQYDVHSVVGMDPMLENPTTSAGPQGYRPSGASPAINAGCPLTTTVGSGSGTTVPVGNAMYFTNGFGLIEGDSVCIADNPPVTVTGRDIDAHTITVDTAVSWSDGDPVTFEYIGTAPDIGAFEVESGTGKVVRRHILYNDSYFDGHDPAANADDDGAIAPDKAPLLSGQTATFANYTSYARGINGIVLDIEGLGGTPIPEDFLVKVGNDNDPTGWEDGPLPSTVGARPGAGTAGSDRVTVLWDDNAIENQWMQLTVKANARTGLAHVDRFYFGNAIGETGNTPDDAEVSAWDIINVRNNPHTLGVNPATIDDPCDFNRDGRVSPCDEVLVRNNATNFMTALRLITVP